MAWGLYINFSMLPSVKETDLFCPILSLKGKFTQNLKMLSVSAQNLVEFYSPQIVSEGSQHSSILLKTLNKEVDKPRWL